jgi:hypothetical protein
MHFMAGRLAPASEVAGGYTIQFLKGVARGLPNGNVCPPETFEAGARRPAIKCKF